MSYNFTKEELEEIEKTKPLTTEQKLEACLFTAKKDQQQIRDLQAQVELYRDQLTTKNNYVHDLREQIEKLQQELAACKIKTPCPSCGNTTLFVGNGGHLTCGLIGCKRPDTETYVKELAAIAIFYRIWEKDQRAKNSRTCGKSKDAG